MKAFILAIATALPQYSCDQDEISQKIIKLLDLQDETAQYIKRLYKSTSINRRYSVLPDIIDKTESNSTFFNENFLENITTTEVRNNIYIKEAPQLAKNAVNNVLEHWGQSATDITHIISVSCTGVMAPGIEFIIQDHFNMKSSVQRLGINFMGCFGAFRALAVANALALENPSNRILIVCTELCSLHFQVAIKPEILVGNALFSDGSAAVIVGCSPKKDEKAIWSIEKCGSYSIEDTQDKMTWKLSDQGCVMNLSRNIPEIIEQRAPKFIQKFIGDKNFNSITWAIHPGGKSIIKAIERSCNLTCDDARVSWKVLEQYGNMSSATFLFVLKELLNCKNEYADTIGLGFGPGLSIEAIMLKRIESC